MSAGPQGADFYHCEGGLTALWRGSCSCWMRQGGSFYMRNSPFAGHFMALGPCRRRYHQTDAVGRSGQRGDAAAPIRPWCAKSRGHSKLAGTGMGVHKQGHPAPGRHVGTLGCSGRTGAIAAGHRHANHAVWLVRVECDCCGRHRLPDLPQLGSDWPYV